MLERPIARNGQFRVGVVRRARPHVGLPAGLVPAQRLLDTSALGVRRARRDDGQVGLGEPPRHQRLAQEPRGGLGLGGQDHARGVAVQPMDQPGPGLPRLREGPQQFIQRMDLAATALAGQARGLVQRQDFGVLVENEAAHERDLVGRELDRLGIFHALRLPEHAPFRHRPRVPDEEQADRHDGRGHDRAHHGRGPRRDQIVDQ